MLPFVSSWVCTVYTTREPASGVELAAKKNNNRRSFPPKNELEVTVQPRHTGNFEICYAALRSASPVTCIPTILGPMTPV